MPDLSFEIRAVWVRPFAVVPTLVFEMRIVNAVAEEEVFAAALRCQMRIEAMARELYWMTVAVPVPRFTGETLIEVPVACYEDHVTAAGKYFQTQKDGVIPLTFLFSGTLFYGGPDGVVRVGEPNWEREASFSMPAGLWQVMMDLYFPNMRWLAVRHELFEKLRLLASIGSYPTLDICLEELVGRALLVHA
jgi:hypothetical protein